MRWIGAAVEHADMAERALAAAGGFQVVEDLEAAADCRQGKTSGRAKYGSGRQS